MEEIAEQIREIKFRFRQAMNGVASTQMREQGLCYKLNFGIELPRLQAIASEFPKNHELAQTLWKEEIRESKILAAMLMPVERFYPEVADIWVEQIPTQEIAELTVMYLFQHLPYASEAAFRWVADNRPMFEVCGLLLLTRLCMRGCEFNEAAAYELVDQAITAMQDPHPQVARQAFILLRRYMQNSREQAAQVLDALKGMTCNDECRQGWMEQLQYEAETDI